MKGRMPDQRGVSFLQEDTVIEYQLTNDQDVSYNGFVYLGSHPQ